MAIVSLDVYEADGVTRRILDEFEECAAAVDRSIADIEAAVIQIGFVRRQLRRHPQSVAESLHKTGD